MGKQWHILLTALLLTILGCSTSPSNDDLSWYAKYTVPLVNKSFYISDLLNELVQDTSFFITDPDTGTDNLGDTFSLHITKSDLKTYESILFNSEQLNFNYKFSNLSLCSLPIISDTISFSLSNDSLSSGILKLKDQIKTEFFNKLKFDSLENLLNLEVINISDSIVINSLNFILNDENNNLLLSDFTENIDPASSFKKQISMSNSSLRNELPYEVLLKYSKIGKCKDEFKVVISLDFNDLTIISGELSDLYFNYNFEQQLYLPVSIDGFNLNYIDLIDIKLPLKIKNPFLFEVNAEILFNSMADLDDVKNFDNGNWKESSSIINLGSRRKNSFAFKIDANESGNSFKESSVLIDFEDKRLFGLWDSLFHLCYVPVTVTGSIKSEGKILSVSNDLEIGIAVENPVTEINEIKGIYEKPYFVNGIPDDFDMPLTDLEHILSVIRDKVKLADNELSVKLQFIMPDSSLISDVKYWCIMMMYAGSEIVEDTLSWRMTDIVGGDINTYLFKVNNMVNTFPDSIKYRIDYEFPKGAEIHLMDTLFKNENGKSSIIMNVNFNLELTSSLVWEISEKVCIDLGVMDIPISLLSKKGDGVLKDKVFYTQFDICNQTNFSGRLISLGSAIEDRSSLESISIDSLLNLFSIYSQDTTFIPIIGNAGIELPGRGNVKEDLVYLSNDNMNKILDLDSMSIRFGLLVFPTELDALIDTDFVSINASATLEGVQSLNDLDL